MYHKNAQLEFYTNWPTEWIWVIVVMHKGRQNVEMERKVKK